MSIEPSTYSALELDVMRAALVVGVLLSLEALRLFPPGRDLIVEHRYTPGTGGTVSTAFGNAELRQHDYMRDQVRRYCADADFLAAAGRMVRDPATVNVSEQWISYILTTGGNWRSPIGDFRMVIDKGRPDAIVSFCGQGVRRISPTQFEVRHRNWRPDRDLAVLIVSAEPRE